MTSPQIDSIHIFHNAEKYEYFINIAGIGISSNIVQLKEKIPKWTPGALKYIVPTIGSVPAFKPLNLKISHDGGKMDAQTIALFICNGQFSGGGMKFGPEAQLFDGLLNITLIEKIPLHQLLLSLPKLYAGKIHKSRYIKTIQTKKITIHSEDAPGVELDGEFVGAGGFDIELLPAVMPVCFPANSRNSLLG